jgi:hypothetical protein
MPTPNNTEVTIPLSYFEQLIHHRDCNLYFFDTLDQVFQGKDAILPDFVPLAHSKVEAVRRLALAYKELQQKRFAAGISKSFMGEKF